MFTKSLYVLVKVRGLMKKENNQQQQQQIKQKFSAANSFHVKVIFVLYVEEHVVAVVRVIK